MPLAIEDSETEALARRLAKRTGKSPQAVIREALEEKYERMAGETPPRAGRPRRREAADLSERLAPILAQLDRLRRDDPRTDEEILGYDEQGLPR